MNKFWIVALETYKRNVKNATFIVMILAPFIMAIVVGAMGYFTSGMGHSTKIAVVATDTAIRDNFIKQTDLDLELTLNTEEDAKRALEAEDIEGYLVISNDQATGQISGNYVATTNLGTTEQTEINQILTKIQMGQTMTSLNLSEADVARLTQPATLANQIVEFGDEGMVENKTNHLALSLVSFFIGFAMYMIIIMYAQVTAVEVASEKGTRIMEIILSSTTASKHFYGKVMGIFLVILTQVLAYIAIALGAYVFIKEIPAVKDFLVVMPVQELVKGLLGYNLIYLLFGVMIYTILAAFCGSLVSKAEDAGKAATPVTFITIIGFFANSMFGLSDPQHIVMKVTSYIPFLSSFTMPSRIASGTVSNLGVMISLAILVVATGLVLVISGRMYGATALVYSDDGLIKSLKKSLTLMRNEKKTN